MTENNEIVKISTELRQLRGVKNVTSDYDNKTSSGSILVAKKLKPKFPPLAINIADNIAKQNKISDKKQFYELVLEFKPEYISINDAAETFNLCPRQVAYSLSQAMGNRRQGIANFNPDIDLVFRSDDMIDAIMYW
jgi:hypothetical protein